MHQLQTPMVTTALYKSCVDRMVSYRAVVKTISTTNETVFKARSPRWAKPTTNPIPMPFKSERQQLLSDLEQLIILTILNDDNEGTEDAIALYHPVDESR
ncbi:hypothetical protein BC939DRAFT_503100 [Gamsiella multidivaricata]|uniref:uncharacterized protein n=1 Tax=Gamsiella multidivaricata TaxID=101098 RepID=UPI00221FB75D|nr:uncharacterized protein BC939DRAFT_503100 [Gamsiella multidivaricata]KAI7823523.1 hypothetical protein BC939DRAFT_503100 [Gamsiella multidivaricata]